MKKILPVLFIMLLLFTACFGGGIGDDNYPPCTYFSADEVGQDMIPVFSGPDTIHAYSQTNEYYFDVYVEGFISDPPSWNTNPYCEHGDSIVWGFRFRAYKLTDDGRKYLQGVYVPKIAMEIDGQYYQRCNIIEDPEDPYDPSYYTGVFLIPLPYNGDMYTLDPFEQLFHLVESIYLDDIGMNLSDRNY